MKRWLVWLFLCGVCLGQCDTAVVDDANALKGHETDVLMAGQDLIKAGADLRVRTVAMTTSSLDAFELSMERSCPSWQVNGNRKSTLVVLMVAPAAHQMGLYYGAAFHKAFDDHWNRIKQDYMRPRFHDGDFAGGMIAAEGQLAKRIVASEDEAQHPLAVTNTTVEQPTDLTGLWWVLWCFGLLTVIGGTIYYVLRHRTALAEAKADAVAARNEAARKVEQYGAGADPTKAVWVESYARLAGYEKNNPDTANLTLGEYRSLRTAYQAIADALSNSSTPTPAEHKKHTKVRMDNSKEKFDEGMDPVIRESPTAAPSSTTVVAPIILAGDTFGQEREDDDSSSYRSSPSRSRDDDDDSSSSSSSGGGSSDYSSSSSDFGGGGSSDFGGGGDSGGGGSSSF